MLTASMTNVITNFLHASFLLVYAISSLIYLLRKDLRFSLFIVLFFFGAFVLKIMGVYVHYTQTTEHIILAWILISFLVILNNYFISQGMQMPDNARILIMVISVLFSFLFVVKGINRHAADIASMINFTYIALSIVMIYCIAAYYSNSMLRTGFILIVLSNIIWITVRNIVNHLIGQEIPAQYQYDNDFYHLLLIISTTIIYVAIIKGYWKKPFKS
jgi:hypothetical protein